MAVVVYKCDTCKREIELPQVVDGLEVMSRCVITSGCKGRLSQTSVKTSYLRGKLPDPDPSGLQDWLPRRVYFKLEQPVPLRIWKVVHNLGTNPSQQIYIIWGGILTPISETSEKYTIKYVSPFELNITFSDPHTGIVECFARSSITDEKREIILTQTKPTVSSTNIMGGGVISLAVPSKQFVDTLNAGDLKIGFISPVTNTLISMFTVTFTSSTSSLSPWWKQTTIAEPNVKLFFAGKVWYVMTTALMSESSILAANIPDGAPLFFTLKRRFNISSVNVSTNTVTVDEILDTIQLPEQIITIDNTPYTIVNSLITSTSTVITIDGTVNVGWTTAIVDYPIDSSQIYVLLSKEPFYQVDRIYGKIMDLKKFNYKQSAAYQIAEIVYTPETTAQVIYPPIIVT